MPTLKVSDTHTLSVFSCSLVLPSLGNGCTPYKLIAFLGGADSGSGGVFYSEGTARIPMPLSPVQQNTPLFTRRLAATAAPEQEETDYG